MAYIDASGFLRVKIWKYSTLDPIDELKFKRKSRLFIRLLDSNGGINLLTINIKEKTLQVSTTTEQLQSITSQLNALGVISGQARLSNVNGLATFANLDKPIIKRGLLYYLFKDEIAYSFIKPNDKNITNFIKGRSLLTYKPLTYESSESEVKVAISWKQMLPTQFEMKLSRIKNLDDIKMFIAVVGRILASYMTNRSAIEQMFTDVVGPVSDQTDLNQWDNLNSIAPDIFGPNYGKIVVSSKAYPVIISNVDQAPAGVNVTEFVYDKYRLLLVPSSPSTHPYFGLKANKKYPSERSYLPAYFKTPQMTGEKPTVISKVLGISTIRQRRATKKESTTDNNILDYGKRRC